MDDRGDRYPRARSQEGRWGRDRERDDRERMDRYPENDVRRDVRDERGEPRDRELFRAKMEARASISHEPVPQSKELSPPPVAPSAPAFGSVPNRMTEGYVPASATGKMPPTAPRAFGERPPSAGQHGSHDSFVAPTGPSNKPSSNDSTPIPLGPRAQPKSQQRALSNQWVNPNFKKTPESPKMMRAQTFAQQHHPQYRRDSFQPDVQRDDERRPRSSDGKADFQSYGSENRSRHYSAEPGEITVNSGRDGYVRRESIDRDRRPANQSRDTSRATSYTSPTVEAAPKFQNQEDRPGESKPLQKETPKETLKETPKETSKEMPKEMSKEMPKEMPKETPKETPRRQRKRPAVKFLRFELPPKVVPPEQLSESEDDEDMGDYFAKEMEKTEVELSKLEKPNLPTEVMVRFAGLSHGSMVKVLSEGEGLSAMIQAHVDIPLPPSPPPMEMDEVKANTPSVTQEEKDIEMADAMTDVPSTKGDEEKGGDEIRPEMPETTEQENKEQESREQEGDPATEKQSESIVPTDLEIGKEKEEVATAEQSVPAEETSAPEPSLEPAIEPQPKTEEMEIDGADKDIPPAPTELLEKAVEIAPVEPTVENAVAEPVDSLSIQPEQDKTQEAATTIVEKPLLALLTPGVPLETTETASKPPSTPSQVADDDETESEDESYMNIDSVRRYMTTPPLDSLPDYRCQPWDKDQDLLRSLSSDSVIDDYVMDHFSRIHIEKTTEQQRDQKTYADNYVRYLDFTTSSDPAAVKSRGKFNTTTTVDSNGVVTPEPKPEGRGSGRRFATERDLERVLQASMREDEERKERELRAQQEKYRSDKEAVIPDMHWTEQDKANIHWVDRSGYTPQDRLVAAWRVLPPINTFTAEESSLFEKKYLEHPKQWGKIAENVPERDFGTCIQYYYMKKKELNLKEKLKKQPKRRKKGGRGKQRSSALVSELGNGEPETEDSHETGENGERKRPRRAAAPTWGFEQPPLDPESGTPVSTPGRRGASAAKGDHPEKVDGRKGRRRAKDKEPKASKAQQTLAAAPPHGTGRGRSRSTSRVQNNEYQTPTPTEGHRLPTQYEQPAAGVTPGFPVQQQQPIQSNLDRPQPVASSLTEVMAAPTLRPEPPQLQPPQPVMTTFNLGQPQQQHQEQQPQQQKQQQQPPSERNERNERKGGSASSYWSVSEANDFPLFLAAFGSDWNAIATHMGSKTTTMVSRFTSCRS